MIKNRLQITSSFAPVFSCTAFVFFFAICGLTTFAATQQNEKIILANSSLSKGFDMGVDSSEHKRDWLSKEIDYMKMSFPAYQDWAAVFITIGRPKDPPRPFLDFSEYKTLSIDMRGQSGGEEIEIGIKTNVQPDTGEETKVTVKLTPEWKNYSFPLAEFRETDLKHLYVLTEFVYNGKEPQTVYFRNIKYLR